MLMGPSMLTLPASLGSDQLSILNYGATGLGVADDRDAFTAAIADAVLQKKALYLPPGEYRTSKYIDVNGIQGLHIIGDRAIVYYGSDTLTAADSIATSIAMARSCFLLRYCSDTIIEGVIFKGGTSPDLNVAQQGTGVYATHCVNTTMRNCTAINGRALYAQDALANTTGTGDSLTVTAGVVTVVDAAAAFVPGHAARFITIAGATNEVNNGTFRVASYVGTTSLTYANANAITETSSFSWTMDDSDHITLIDGGFSYNVRGNMYGGNDVVIQNHTFEHPDTDDATGVGDSYTISGTTVTLKDYSLDIKKRHLGKYIKTAGSTSAANDGWFKITGVTEATTTTPASITFENASGVTELYTGKWWIMGGEKTGIGAGATALSKSSNTLTLTSLTAAFTASDIGSGIRIAGATTANNNGLFTILTVPSSTTLTYTNSAGASETFSKGWSIDSYDRTGTSTAGFGASHFVYCFAGRGNWLIKGCTFRNCREVGVKFSGSNADIIDISVDDNTFTKCAGAALFGSDDRADHVGFLFTNNRVNDCGTGRTGWGTSTAVSILGSRGVQIKNNIFRYTRNSIGAVDGTGVGSTCAINASRFTAGVSTPVEGFDCDGNEFICEPNSTSVGSVFAIGVVNTSKLGSLAYYRTGGTLTKSGNIMTLTDSSASFNQKLVGHTLALVNSASSNDITNVVVESVPSSTTLTFTNAAGTGSGASAGTYRIWPSKTLTSTNQSDKPVGGGVCNVTNNKFDCASTVSFVSTSCVAPVFADNTVNLGSVQFVGDVAPQVRDNIMLGGNTFSAQIRFDSGTSWPTEGNNTVVNPQALGGSISVRGWGIGVDSTTIRDYPFRGWSGRIKPAGAYEEVVLGYGSLHVDGDTLLVSGTTCTYKATSPGAGQFNTQATLITLINAISGYTAADAGTGFSTGDVTTGHIRIRRLIQSSSDAGTLTVRAYTLNPTALVMLRNHQTSTPFSWGRGAGSPSNAGPIANRSVIWSLLANYSATPILTPDNDAARALLSGGKAMGRIVFPAKANLVDAETFTIPDGTGVAKVYEFDVTPNGVTAGRVLVDVSGATTAADVAAIARTAILANQPMLSVSSNYGDLTVTAVDTTALLETLTITGHKLRTGDQVMISTDGGLPAGLSAATYYWVIYHTANKIALATTLANAMGNTRINITTAGTGTHTIRHGAITITNNWPGAGGNGAITETVAHADMVVGGMSNGGPGGYMAIKATEDDGACIVIKHARCGDFAGNDTQYTSLAFATGDVDITGSVETIQIVGHGLVTGDKVRLSSTTTLPAPLAIDTDYWVIYDTDDKIALATTWLLAMAGTRLNLTDVGTGSHTLRTGQVPEFRWTIE